jgi:phosphoesterase RecJ-like protein
MTSSEENQILDSLSDELLNVSKIVVAGHASPDPDTVGSALALVLSLRELGKDAEVYFQDPPPLRLEFLPGVELIKDTLPNEPIDLFILVDAGSLDRIGPLAVEHKEKGNIKKWCILDHHISSRPIADINYIKPEMSSTGEVVWQVIKNLETKVKGFKTGKAVATCVYAAIVTDTGSFQFANTTENAHLIAAECLRLGVDADSVSFRLFRSMKLSRLELMKRAIESLKIEEGGKIASVILSKEDFEETGGLEEEADSFAGMFLGLEGLEAVIYLRQYKGKPVKLSVRSKGLFNASEFCTKLGGGGHARAAGATLEGSLEENRKMVVDTLKSRFPYI